MTTARRVHVVACALSLLAASLVAPPADAQGVRITGVSLANYVELRPVAEDSIPDSLTVGTGFARESAAGPVTCLPGHSQCYFYRSLSVNHTIPLTQDLEATGWGFGQGVSVYAHLRANANGGGVSELWTREDEHFNALAAYVEIDRERWTARAGRQWLTSQLGYNNFDGASLVLRTPARLVVEGDAGWSLIQGLSEPPTSDELAAADVLPPDKRGILLRASARWRPTLPLAVGAEYQRVIRTDRAGLYEERVAVDGAFTAGDVSVTGDVQTDLATGAFNDARLRASRPFANGITGSVEAVHSTPFFPLWTIWGVFAPVGYNEASASAAWASARNDRSFSLSAGYRQYQDTHTGVGFLPLRDNGWTVIGLGAWRVLPSLDVTGSYRRDIGFGASKSDGNLGVRWDHGDATWIGLTASALQNIYEFRVANGYLAGAALDGGIPLTPNVRLDAQVGIYRNIAAKTSSTVDWSQHRALVRLEWYAGQDPGMRALRGSAQGQSK